MADFKLYLPTLLKHEGGYVNHPNDPGGETKYGISKRSYPKEDIKNMTMEKAGHIYYMDYWVPMQCDKFNSQSVAEIIFDHCVNAGMRSAVCILQKCAGAVVDGHLGPKTIAAVNNAIPAVLFALIKAERLAYYQNLVDGRPTLQVFINGWHNRVNSFIFTS
ncbi:MAG: Secretion activator protein [Candidatus Woesebacteria bacterium GW2011_GWA1_39_11b]|nr:MAG: Secretion activator protein [Candidatus Woesebacteria bacterium GW2011_GWA1_39_11b]KKS77119.1 MAG: Secretion activator protein [Candidatus Woesebacteria bacterium GW2011_GWC1_42_9]